MISAQRRLLIFIIVLLLAAGAGLFLLTRPKELAVGYQPAAANYPMMYALEGGFFEKQGLKPKVKVFQSANEALDALLAKNIFMDAVIPIQNIATIESERPGTIGVIAVLLSDLDNPIDYLIVPKESSIASVRDLEGKTVVVFPGTFSETLTRLTLDKLGIRQVTFLKLPPADMAQAIRSGRADAGIVYEPVASLAEHQGWGRILARGLWEEHLISPIVIGAYAYNKSLASENPALLERSTKAIHLAVEDAKANPLRARRTLLNSLQIPEELLQRLPSARVEMADAVDITILQRTIDLYMQHKIIQTPLDIKALFTRTK